jgi:exodeoxyribonuclease V gamma subunit
LNASPGEACLSTVRAHIVLRHPLQPFSPRYFGADPDARLFSYAEHYRDGARALVQPHRGTPPPFLAAPLAPPAETPRAVALDDLARFFENPARAFLQTRLALHLGGAVEELDDREPMELDSLARWEVGSGLLERALAGENLDDALPSVRASGRLPLGVLGACVYDDVRSAVDQVASAAARCVRGTRLEPVVIDAAIEDTRITGIIADIWPQGLVQYQFSKVGQRHELGVWIRHLVLNWLMPSGYPTSSFLVGRPASDGSPIVRFHPVRGPAAILQELVRLYWLGQTAPLPLFPQASRTYAEALRRAKAGDTEERALQKAISAFNGSQHRRGDADDPYVRQVFGDRDAFAPASPGCEDPTRPSFQQLAQIVFGPLLDHREELL